MGITLNYYYGTDTLGGRLKSLMKTNASSGYEGRTAACIDVYDDYQVRSRMYETNDTAHAIPYMRKT